MISCSCEYIYRCSIYSPPPVEMEHVWQFIYTIRLFPKMRSVHVIYCLIQPNLNPNYWNNWHVCLLQRVFVQYIQECVPHSHLHNEMAWWLIFCVFVCLQVNDTNVCTSCSKLVTLSVSFHFYGRKWVRWIRLWKLTEVKMGDMVKARNENHIESNGKRRTF